MGDEAETRYCCPFSLGIILLLALTQHHARPSWKFDNVWSNRKQMEDLSQRHYVTSRAFINPHESRLKSMNGSDNCKKMEEISRTVR